MANISTANFSITSGPGTPIQYEWSYNPRGCGRIPPDFDLPILCVGSGGWGGYIESVGADMAAAESCCPLNGGTNMYRAQDMCMSVECFTKDTALASHFNECYKDAVVAQVERLRRTNSSRVTKHMTRDNANARCEYIDYAWVKRGLFNKSSSGGSRKEKVVGVVGWAVMGGCLATMFSLS